MTPAARRRIERDRLRRKRQDPEYLEAERCRNKWRMRAARQTPPENWNPRRQSTPSANIDGADAR